MGSNRQKRNKGQNLKTSALKNVSLFRGDLEAVFVCRPNRFLVIAKADGGAGNGRVREIPCHCPNPGRMEELLFPGAKLILEKRLTKEKTVRAKTEYTAAGLYYRDSVVPLVSARANRAAQALVLRKIIPGIREIRAEFSVGNSRFDFLCVDKQGTRHLVEVKACSLVEYGTAMFPDAPSLRALKHLEELSKLGENGFVCHVLFIIVHGCPNVFIPNLHTDPAFANALTRYAQTSAGADSGAIKIHAALIRCDRDGGAALVKASVRIDFSHGNLAARNSGSYLVILNIAKTAEVAVGSLGKRAFRAGWYVYAGSAIKNLNQRIGRHLRKTRKAKHWHIDYLVPHAQRISALPIRSYRNLECDLAAAIKAAGGAGVPRFGCSDCLCGSHLYYFADNPMENRSFVEMVLRFRHVESLQEPVQN